MSLLGYIETPQENGIAGWCFGEDSDEPLRVEVSVNGIPLRTLVANMPRHDIEAQHGRRDVGFFFAIDPELAALFPESCTIRFEIDGTPLRSGANREGVDFKGGSEDTSVLEARLAEGWTINKWGGLSRQFRHFPDLQKQYLEFYNDLYNIVYNEYRIKLFMHYGSLLGYYRDAQLIPHDDDFDVSFVIYTDDLHAVARAFYGLAASLKAIAAETGMQISIQETGQMSIWRQELHIDIFSTWMNSKREIFTYFGVSGEWPDKQVALTEGGLLGHKVCVPVLTEELITLTYGPHWKVPDPYFQWQVPAQTGVEMAKLREIGKGYSGVDGLPADWKSLIDSSSTVSYAKDKP